MSPILQAVRDMVRLQSIVIVGAYMPDGTLCLLQLFFRLRLLQVILLRHVTPIVAIGKWFIVSIQGEQKGVNLRDNLAHVRNILLGWGMSIIQHAYNV